MTRSTLIFGLLVFLFSACENIVEYDLGDVESYVVVDAIINPDSIWSVALTYTQQLNDTSDPVKVEGAYVQVSILIDGQGEATRDNIAQKLQLDESEPGIYSIPNYPLEGQTYHMEIRMDGKILEARTYVPKVFSPQVEKTEAEDGSFQLEIQMGEEFEDEVYYAYNLISTRKNVVNQEDESDDGGSGGGPDDDGGLNPANPDGYQEGELLSKNNDISAATPMSRETQASSASSFKIESIDLGTDGSETGTATTSSSEPREYLLKIWAISSDYYQYLISRKGNEFKPSSEFNYDNQYSNVENGGGIFAGYVLKEINIDL